MAKAVYAEMRDAYKKIFEDLKSVINKNIDDLIEDPAEAKKLKDNIYQKMFEGKTIEPYFHSCVEVICGYATMRGTQTPAPQSQCMKRLKQSSAARNASRS